MMIFENNNTGEQRKVETEEELNSILDINLVDQTDFSLGASKNSFAQITASSSDGLFYVGYKEPKTIDAHICMEPCPGQEARKFLLGYFKNSADWKAMFEWEGITSYPLWIFYLILMAAAGIITFITWVENPEIGLWKIPAGFVALIVLTELIRRRRGTSGAVLDVMREIKDEDRTR
ncbi:hypothetical protein BVY04_04515 [bacterium M21]|nr:hypothetical protein BVY04_04515 [bacterium M21]